MWTAGPFRIETFEESRSRLRSIRALPRRDREGAVFATDLLVQTRAIIGI